MVKAGADEQIYPVTKIAIIAEALEARGISIDSALQAIRLPRAALSSPASRVSLNQMLDFVCAVDELPADPLFAFRTGLQFHVTSYGMYGFAILSSTNFRQTIHFAQMYRELA